MRAYTAPRPFTVVGAARRAIRACAEPDGVALEEGLHKRVLSEPALNASRPSWGAIVQILYTCARLNGTVVDKTHASNPFEFQLDTGAVVDGLQRGVASMAVGERALLTCEARWAHGSNGIGKVAGGEGLRYDIELLSCREGPTPESEVLDLETYRTALDGNLVASGSTPSYNWTETGEELRITVELRTGQGKRDIECDLRSRRIRIAVADGGPPIEGELKRRIRSDDSFWVLDEVDGVRTLEVTLAKQSLYARWEGIFK